jgi:hypothetical protein
MSKKINITLLASDYLNILGYSLFFPFFALFAVSIGATPQTTGDAGILLPRACVRCVAQWLRRAG